MLTQKKNNLLENAQIWLHLQLQTEWCEEDVLVLEIFIGFVNQQVHRHATIDFIL